MITLIIVSQLCTQLKRYVWHQFVNNPIDPVHLRTDLNLIPSNSRGKTFILLSLSSYIPFSLVVLFCGCSYDIRPYGGAGWT